MIKYDFFRLADDGCPNCGEPFRTKRNLAAIKPPRKPHILNGVWVHGPRGFGYSFSSHAVEQWVARFGLTPSELVHAVKFGRIIGQSVNGECLALWYEPEAAFMIVESSSKFGHFIVLTVIPTWLMANPLDMKLIATWGSKRKRVA